jgi:hypothetical protein
MNGSPAAVPLSRRIDEIVVGELARRRGPFAALADDQRRAVDALARDVAEAVVRDLLDRAQRDRVVAQALGHAFAAPNKA